jgi:hypothetical protein
MRDMKIQSQDSVIGFAELLANPKHQSRKLAFVVASSLARAQMKHAATGREAGYFTCPFEARIWLLTPEQKQAATLLRLDVRSNPANGAPSP